MWSVFNYRVARDGGRRSGNVRPPRKVGDNVWVAVKSQTGSAVMTIVGASRGETIVSSVCQILVFDAYDEGLDDGQ